MKNTLKTILVGFVVMTGLTAFAGDIPADKEVVVGLNDAYVPGGFDTGSDTYVVSNGVFANGCYRYKRSDVTHKDEFTHEIRTIASVSQGMCLMVLVPFTKEVRLGKFAAGKHALRFVDGNGNYFEKTMTVEQ